MKIKDLFKEFKAFISKGNVLDMATGVIIGGAFNKIVTSLVAILMSVCTWGVPGGINGLVTVLPAANDAQKGLNAEIGIGQSFNIDELHNMAIKLAESNYTASVVEDNLELIESAKTTILNNYTLHGTTYTYNMCSVIDWGSLINAAISFLIIALTLFIIIKVVSRLDKIKNKVKDKLEAELKEKEELIKKLKEEKAKEKNKEEIKEEIND